MSWAVDFDIIVLSSIILVFVTVIVFDVLICVFDLLKRSLESFIFRY